MLALIDGDIVTYRSGFAAQHVRYYFDGQRFENHAELRAYCDENGIDLKDIEVERELEVEPVSHALANVKSIISTICDVVGATDYEVFLSTGDNWRGKVATIKKYKGNRDDATKPEHYNDIWQYLTLNHPTVITESIEADDAMAMCQTNKTVICSLDKDMLQVPGLHYNWVKDSKIVVSPEVGLFKLYQQVLTGDSTDNIPGIRGIGPIKARKIIVEPNTADEEFLFAVCKDHWRDYLAERADWGEWKDDLFHYTPWYQDTPIGRSVEEIVHEVLTLLTVGGDEAYAALQIEGEEIPLPSEKERKAYRSTRTVPFVAGSGHRSPPVEGEGTVRVREREAIVRGTSDSEGVHPGLHTGVEASEDIHRGQGPVHGTGPEEDVADNRAAPGEGHPNVTCEGQYDFEEQSDEILDVVQET